MLSHILGKNYATKQTYLKKGGNHENMDESSEYRSGCFGPVYFYLEKQEKSRDPLMIDISLNKILTS